jgi:RNA polymerase sigma factor (sigma-70 family)
VDAQALKRSDARSVVEEALTRDRAKVEGLLRRRFPALDASEVYQRAAVRALERCDELRDLDRVDAWVRRIAMTCAIDLLRNRRYREITTANPPEVEAPVPDETCACAVSLLTSLPAQYADVLQRVDVDGASLEETACALGIERGNAAVRLHRARRALRGRLQDHCGVATIRECLACECTHRGCCATG